ncbi:hypothetical protein EDD21DRAFT_144417 [Dissophora ornata]|nr:hypothetical protein EDD21DRAFT_144417 [Dissophora ornata]
MIKSPLTLAAIVAAAVSAQTTGTTLHHISFTQPVGDGITYAAGTNQTFSWTMACTTPSTLSSATPNATEVDFMDSNNINNAFYIKKVGTIDCTKSVGNLVWTVPADTKPGVYALQLLLTPNNAYSGRFNVTAPGGSTAGAGGASPPVTAGSSGSSNGNSSNASPGAIGSPVVPKQSVAMPSISVGKTLAAAVAGASVVLGMVV